MLYSFCGIVLCCVLSTSERHFRIKEFLVFLAGALKRLWPFKQGRIPPEWQKVVRQPRSSETEIEVCKCSNKYMLQLFRLFLAHAGSHLLVDVHPPKEASLAALSAAKPATRISWKADRGGDTPKKCRAPRLPQWIPTQIAIFCFAIMPIIIKNWYNKLLLIIICIINFCKKSNSIFYMNFFNFLKNNNMDNHLESWPPEWTRSYLLIPSTYLVDTLLFDEHCFYMVIPATASMSLYILTLSKYKSSYWVCTSCVLRYRNTCQSMKIVWTRYIESLYRVCTEYMYKVNQWICLWQTYLSRTHSIHRTKKSHRFVK